jgi:hypothetical protein
MADQTFTAGQVLTAAQMTTLQANSGLVVMVPTSVGGSGVSVSTGGKVTFTAATPIQVNGCFTSAYDYYRVVMNVTTSSAAGLWNFQLRVGVVNAAGATDYAFSILQSSSAGAWGNLNFNGGTNVISLGYAGPSTSSSSIEFIGPALAQKTSMTVNGNYAGTPYTGGGQHALSTAYDGFAIIPSAGNITGTLMVYGYRD